MLKLEHMDSSPNLQQYNSLPDNNSGGFQTGAFEAGDIILSPSEPKKKSKKWVIFGVLAVVVLGGVMAWLLLSGNNKNSDLGDYFEKYLRVIVYEKEDGDIDYDFSYRKAYAIENEYFSDDLESAKKYFDNLESQFASFKEFYGSDAIYSEIIDTETINNYADELSFIIILFDNFSAFSNENLDEVFDSVVAELKDNINVYAQEFVENIEKYEGGDADVLTEIEERYEMAVENFVRDSLAIGSIIRGEE